GWTSRSGGSPLGGRTRTAGGQEPPGGGLHRGAPASGPAPLGRCAGGIRAGGCPPRKGEGTAVRRLELFHGGNARAARTPFRGRVFLSRGAEALSPQPPRPG